MSDVPVIVLTNYVKAVFVQKPGYHDGAWRILVSAQHCCASCALPPKQNEPQTATCEWAQIIEGPKNLVNTPSMTHSSARGPIAKCNSYDYILVRLYVVILFLVFPIHSM